MIDVGKGGMSGNNRDFREAIKAPAQVGRFTIYRTENKGRLNKRLYVRLDDTLEGP